MVINVYFNGPGLHDCTLYHPMIPSPTMTLAMQPLCATNGYYSPGNDVRASSYAYWCLVASLQVFEFLNFLSWDF